MTRAKTGEANRLGCKYADQYYAAQFGIIEEEAKNAYNCGGLLTTLLKGIPVCPFNFLTECLETIDIPPKKTWKDGVVVGLLNSKGITCSLVPMQYHAGGGVFYECSHCKGTIKGDVTFMAYCYNCGAEIKDES